MNISQVDKEAIQGVFEDVLKSDELVPHFKISQPDIYEGMVKEALTSSGFPSDVDIKLVSHDFKLFNRKDEGEWVEQYVIEQGLDEESTTEVGHDDVENYVFDHLENLNVQITIKDELSEWIERNPTIEYMGKEIESHFNPIEMASFMKRNNYTALQEKEKACIEVGIPKEEAKKVDYEIKNMRIKTSIEALAEIYADEVKNSNTTVQVYLDNNLYENLVTEVDYELEIDVSEQEEL